MTWDDRIHDAEDLCIKCDHAAAEHPVMLSIPLGGTVHCPAFEPRPFDTRDGGDSGDR